MSILPEAYVSGRIFKRHHVYSCLRLIRLTNQPPPCSKNSCKTTKSALPPNSQLACITPQKFRTFSQNAYTNHFLPFSHISAQCIRKSLLFQKYAILTTFSGFLTSWDHVSENHTFLKNRRYLVFQSFFRLLIFVPCYSYHTISYRGFILSMEIFLKTADFQRISGKI